MQTTHTPLTILEIGNGKLCFHSHTGSLVSLHNGRRELLSSTNGTKPLFIMRMRDTAGQPIDVTALEAAKVEIHELSEASDGASSRMQIGFSDFAAADLTVNIFVSTRRDNLCVEISAEINNQTPYIMEWFEVPYISVDNDLIATGGTSRILWPAMEGVLIENADFRESNWLRYKEPGYPSKGWEGIFPGPAPTQFMAYYDHVGGFYLGAHDADANTKSIEYVKNEDGAVKMQFRLFTEGAGQGVYRTDYPMVIALFDGDWHEGADVYRNWFEQRNDLPAKLDNRTCMPEWYKESPIVVTYPVRGTKDVGDMTPNEYFPYVNALPHVDRLAEQLDSKLMVLLMHWEGTAPWAPPYVWPPFGGEAGFREFVDALHMRGQSIGVYCSGIAWTHESLLVPEYRGETEYKEKQLHQIMCHAPDETLPFSLICGGGQRWGYDMCPSSPFVQETVLKEMEAIIDSGCDYVQYFDQNLGGLSYFCYSHDHDHGPGPGKWQAHDMKQLFVKINEMIKEKGKAGTVLVGCESAAAEPFIDQLPFNDNRYNITLFMGVPVPMYQYVYHEYINNFMGNQNTAGALMDAKRSPEHLNYRIAHAFIAGDMLTLVLKGEGLVNWDWGTPWDTEAPNQEAVLGFVKEANAWRKGYAKAHLSYGRMVKPFAYRCEKAEHTIYLQVNNELLTLPPVMSSRWLADGQEVQLFANYTDETQTVFAATGERMVALVTQAEGSEPVSLQANETGSISFTVEARSIVCLAIGTDKEMKLNR